LYIQKHHIVISFQWEWGRGEGERSSLYSAFAHKIVSVLCLFIVIFTAPAAEIEKMIDALTSPRERSDYGNQWLQASLSRGEQNFSRAEFLKKLDRFYPAIEHADAGTHN